MSSYRVCAVEQFMQPHVKVLIASCSVRWNRLYLVFLRLPAVLKAKPTGLTFIVP